MSFLVMETSTNDKTVCIQYTVAYTSNQKHPHGYLGY